MIDDTHGFSGSINDPPPLGLIPWIGYEFHWDWFIKMYHVEISYESISILMPLGI